MMLLEMAAQAAPERVAIGPLDGGLTLQAPVRAGRWGHHVAPAPTGRAGAVHRRLDARPAGRTVRLVVGRHAVRAVELPAGRRAPPADRRRARRRRSCCTGRVGRRARTVSRASSRSTRVRSSRRRRPPTAAEADWSYDPDDIAVLLHTSGTTGEPKVAVLRQRHLVSYVLGTVEFLAAGEDEATLVSVPPYHIAGMAAILTAVYGGRRLVHLPPSRRPTWVRLARDERITHAMVVPTMLGRILDVLDDDGEGLPALRHLSYGGGRMPVAPSIERALRAAARRRLRQRLRAHRDQLVDRGARARRPPAGAGQRRPGGPARLGSVGQPLPTVELSIRDADGRRAARRRARRGLGARRAGLGRVRPRQRSSWRTAGSPRRTPAALDADGYLYLDGRLDDVIVRGGENLSPGEIEDVLLQHPAVARRRRARRARPRSGARSWRR